MIRTAEHLVIERSDGTEAKIHIAGTDVTIRLDTEETRWMMCKLGEALLAPVEPTEPMPPRPPLRDHEVVLVRRMHRASWARDMEPL